jgi:predicted TIM-barrel fold metal-dependent hydrolase
MRDYRFAVMVILGIVSISSSCVRATVPTSASPPVSTFEPATQRASTATEVFEIPIVDAHSQITPENFDKIIQLMDRVGVARTILSPGVTSFKGLVTPESLVSFASKYPGRIVPAVRTKARRYENYYELLEKQVNMKGYGAMAEFLMYHSRKGNRAPEIVVYPDDKRVQTALRYALDRKWPFVIHIEFAAAGCPYDEFMSKLKGLLVQYPQHPFVLIHMGQLDRVAVQQLIETHDNIYFITSSSTSAYAVNPFNDRWTNMFNGRTLSTDWKQVIIKYPDRFIMGFDMVWAKQWGQFYLGQVKLWREAIKELPAEVAHAFTHGNAERLWHLLPSN